MKKARLVNGLPIFSSVLGVFIAYLILAWFDIPVVASFFLMVLYIVVDMIFVQDISFGVSGLLIKYLRSCLEFGVEMLAVLWLNGFVAVLLILWQGTFSGIGMAIIMICVFFIPWLLLMLAKGFIFKKN